MISKRSAFLCSFLTITITTLAIAQDFSIDAHTINGGGGYSAGGDFELEGTIGQHDAGYMAGGDYELEGGFWPSATDAQCACLGDMNLDGYRNGADIQRFVECILVGGSCACADIDGMSGITVYDTTAFVSGLLTGGTCP